MQNPQSPLIRAMADQVTKSWEAYGDKNIIIYQHVEPFDKAQEKLSLLIAQETTNELKQLRIATTTEFLTYFIKSLLKVRIKMEKYQNIEADIYFTKKIDNVLDLITEGRWNEIKLREYTYILFNIGRIYERLGYSSPERERTKTTMQSDMELPGTDTPEYMENPPNIIKYPDREDDIP